MRFIVHPDKLSHCLLDLSSKPGAPKAQFFLAQFFLARGFSAERPHELRAALQRHPLEALLTQLAPDPEGKRLTYECAVAAAGGTRPCIRSVWIAAHDGSECRLITAFPSIGRQ